ncbi:GNAT family N-acetyltransferase [Paroceanicella profunda]|nr:GNAT family N-acetyltransferase [Paroceanicella profunda]
MTAAPAPIVRPARPEDRPVLERFMAALQAHELACSPGSGLETPARMAAPHLRWLEGWVAESGGVILVAESGDTLLGFAVCGISTEGGYHLPERLRRHGEVSDLYVEDPARGRGVGRALLDAAAEAFRSRGLARMTITAMRGNPETVKVYRGLFGAETFLTFETRL